MVIDMKKKNSKISLTLIIIILISFIILVYYITRQVNNYQPVSYDQPTPATTINQEFKEYKSLSMQMTIVVSARFQIQDQAIRLILSKNGGVIIVDKEGTQFTDLDSYLKDLDSKNRVRVIDQSNLQINGYAAKTRIVNYPGGPRDGEKTYVILVGSRIYSFSTGSESLYPDLDQIAQSFHYTP